MQTTENFEYFLGDAFIHPEKPFSGNPAAVFILENDSDIDDEAKKALGRKFNLSATVFVSKLANDDRFLIRWFGPLDEIKLCGHGTIVASFVLFTQKHLYREFLSLEKPIRYRTKFGAQLEANYDGQFVSLDFPNNAPVPIDKMTTPWVEPLTEALLGSAPKDYLSDVQLSPINYLLLRLRDNVDLTKIKPNFGKVNQIEVKGSVILAMITRKLDFSQDRAHFECRAFAPWQGLNEDPVCGSAFTVMTPFWTNVFQFETDGKVDSFLARQASSCGGLVKTQLQKERVIIAGQVKLSSNGTYYL